MMTFWDTALGNHLAETLIRELPKLEELTKALRSEKDPVRQTAEKIGSDYDAARIAEKISSGNCRMIGSFSGPTVRYVVLEESKEKR